MADFEAWKRENLVKLAAELTADNLRQASEIESLRSDLRLALNAYRAALVKGTNEKETS
jgi:hypothetical protein